MSLKDAQQRLKKDVSCRTLAVYQALDKEDKKTFDGFVADKLAPGAIHRILVMDGIKIGDKAVRYHLTGSCVCLEGSAHKGAYRESA